MRKKSSVNRKFIRDTKENALRKLSQLFNPLILEILRLRGKRYSSALMEW